MSKEVVGIHCTDIKDFFENPTPGKFIWRGEPTPGRIMFQCPCGCGDVLGAVVTGDASKGPVWGFNGNYEKPTLSPSIRHLNDCKWHGFLVDGVFKFCDG